MALEIHTGDILYYDDLTVEVVEVLPEDDPYGGYVQGYYHPYGPSKPVLGIFHPDELRRQ